jgi:hypothetical protein
MYASLLVAFIGWIIQAIALVWATTVFAVHALWVTVVQAAIAFIEVVDEWVVDIEILDNAVFRMILMGGVGFMLGVGLMVLLSLAIGMWGIPLAFFLSMGFCAFVGLVADPDEDWSLGDFPLFGDQPPKMPLNL